MRLNKVICLSAFLAFFSHSETKMAKAAFISLVSFESNVSKRAQATILNFRE